MSIEYMKTRRVIVSTVMALNDLGTSQEVLHAVLHDVARMMDEGSDEPPVDRPVLTESEYAEMVSEWRAYGDRMHRRAMKAEKELRELKGDIV